MQVISEPKGEGKRRVQLFFDRDVDSEGKPDKLGPSRNRVKPEFLKESRIENILKRATKTGMIQVRQGARFGDFTSGQDYLTLRNRMIEVEQYFDTLSSDDRNFFNNDVKNYLDFVTLPQHREEAEKRGFLKKPAAEPAPSAPVPDTPAAPAPAPAVPVAAVSPALPAV